MVAEKLWLFLLGMAAAAFLSTCFVFLEPGQQALVECFGHSATASTVIGPGAHLKWPWPIDKVYRFDTGAVQSFNVGFIPDPAHSNDTTAVWTTPHYKEEYNVLVASRDQQVASVTNQAPGEQSAPVNLVVVGIPVQYRITNVLEWAYGQADEAGARALLQQAATREIVRYFAGVDLLASMSDQREAAAKELQVRIQTQATQLHLGAEILFVGLQDIHPPVKVAGAFEDVNGAEQEVLSKILKAEADTNKTILLAGAQARAKVRTAEGAAGNRVLSAQAEAARFLNEMVAYDAAPEVYRQRMLLETLASTYSGARKYIIGPTNYYDVFQYNFEDQVGPDILKRMSVTNR
jgi:regulator of protease activity HflC (stomatin/prohibitin superfamily)